MRDWSNHSINDFFNETIRHGMDHVRSKHKCPSLPDNMFLEFGIKRVFYYNQSGRDWLQKLDEVHNAAVPTSTWFNAFNTSRRARMSEEALRGAIRYMERTLLQRGVDSLKCFPELERWQVYAVDGHTIEHACHAPKVQHGEAESYPESKSIYMMNLRTGLLEPLAAICGANGKLTAHEMPAFREHIAQHTGKAPTLIIGDPAYHDKHFWTGTARKNKEKGPRLDFLSKVKKSHKFLMRQPQPFDKQDPVNTGVTELSMVYLDNTAAPLYLVGYQDPEDGKYYEFLTTVGNFRPGLIAWLYFTRWRIEKGYDTFKNGLKEEKDWAGTNEAQRIRNALVCFAYNLLHTFQKLLESDFALKDEKVERKYRKRLQQREQQAQNAAGGNCFLNPMLKLPRMAQVSRQFIRTIRNYLSTEQPIHSLIPVFSATLKSYL